MPLPTPPSVVGMAVGVAPALIFKGGYGASKFPPVGIYQLAEGSIQLGPCCTGIEVNSANYT